MSTTPIDSDLDKHSWASCAQRMPLSLWFFLQPGVWILSGPLGKPDYGDMLYSPWDGYDFIKNQRLPVLSALVNETPDNQWMEMHILVCWQLQVNRILFPWKSCEVEAADLNWHSTFFNVLKWRPASDLPHFPIAAFLYYGDIAFQLRSLSSSRIAQVMGFDVGFDTLYRGQWHYHNPRPITQRRPFFRYDFEPMPVGTELDGFTKTDFGWVVIPPEYQTIECPTGTYIPNPEYAKATHYSPAPGVFIERFEEHISKHGLKDAVQMFQTQAGADRWGLETFYPGFAELVDAIADCKTLALVNETIKPADTRQPFFVNFTVALNMAGVNATNKVDEKTNRNL